MSQSFGRAEEGGEALLVDEAHGGDGELAPERAGEVDLEPPANSTSRPCTAPTWKPAAGIDRPTTSLPGVFVGAWAARGRRGEGGSAATMASRAS